MRKLLIENIKYVESTITGKPLYYDTYVLVNDQGRMLWHENLFLIDLARSSSLNTVRGYANGLLSFVNAHKEIGGWRSVRPKHMTGYLHGELFQRRSYAPATMSHHIEALKRFYGWLVRKGYLQTMPDFEWGYRHLYSSIPTDNTAHLATQHSLNTLYIDHDTYDKLLASIISTNFFIRTRDCLALQLGYECGTRAHEVLKLDAEVVRKAINAAKDDNDGLWATTEVKITGKGSADRMLLLPPGLCESIMDYLKRWRMKLNNGHGPLLCTVKGLPIRNEKYASNVFAAACKQAGIHRKHHQGYHRLRKSYGTNMVNECYAAGTDPWVEVPRRMGHKDVETTKRYIQFDALRNRRSHVLSQLSMTASKFKGIQTAKGDE